MMRRTSLMSVVVAAALVVAACSGSEDAAPEPPPESTTQPTAAPAGPVPGLLDCEPPAGTDPELWEPPGECLPGFGESRGSVLMAWHQPESECWPTCVEYGTFLDDGSLLWWSADGVARKVFDPSPVIAAVEEGVDDDDLVLGPQERDCGRDADGLAPVLLVAAAEPDAPPAVADECSHVLDESHPLVAFALDAVADARGDAVPVLAEARVPVCPDGSCDERERWTVAVDGTVLRHADLEDWVYGAPVEAFLAGDDDVAAAQDALRDADALCSPLAVEPEPDETTWFVQSGDDGGTCWTLSEPVVQALERLLPTP